MNLKIFNSKGKLLVHLRQHLGVTTIIEATDDLRPAAQRWLDNGLSEWVDGPPISGGVYQGSMPRHTPVSSPEFLFRIRDYLQRQFNSFRYEIDLDILR